MPASSWRPTAARIASRPAAAIADGSTASPRARLPYSSSNCRGRGRLPVWVVRMRSLLHSMVGSEPAQMDRSYRDPRVSAFSCGWELRLRRSFEVCASVRLDPTCTRGGGSVGARRERMRGARRRPYVDMVKPGNEADGAPQGGAGAPMFFRGCDPAGAQARVQVRRCGPLPGRTYACTC